MIVTFEVQGDPITQGSLRRGGRGQVFHDNAKLMPWRNKIAAAALKEWFKLDPAERVQLTDPDTAIEVLAVFRLPRPKSVRRRWPTRKNDLDKLGRALLDGITDSGLWADDGQVCRSTTSKIYADAPLVPGVQVAVRVIT